MIRVVKIGGSIIEDELKLHEFCRNFAAIEGPKILVHGGGTAASSLQKALGQTPVKIEGRRVTDSDALKAVTYVYAGWCNKRIVALLQSLECNATGLSGCDGNVICARRRPPRTLSDGVTSVDYGYVGDVGKKSVNAGFLRMLLDGGYVPVLCAINHDGKGQLLNTNADTVASSVAAAMHGRLECCFEMDGVLSDRNDPSSVIPQISEVEFDAMVRSGSVSEGMIPKIENCLYALKNGALEAVIKNSNAIAIEGIGTRICL